MFLFFHKGNLRFIGIDIFIVYHDVGKHNKGDSKIAKDLRCRQRELENGIITVVACITRLPCVSI